jgi:hypothetical protein
MSGTLGLLAAALISVIPGTARAGTYTWTPTAAGTTYNVCPLPKYPTFSGMKQV